MFGAGILARGGVLVRPSFGRRSIQPPRLLERGVLLNRAVDLLGNPGVVDLQRANAIRETVRLFPAARGREVVHNMPAEARAWQPQLAEPVVFDLREREAAPRVDVQPDRELLGRNLEAGSEELRKETNHGGIGIRETHGVPFLRTLRPIEHAARLMHGIWIACPGSALGLVCPSLGTIEVRPGRGPVCILLAPVALTMFGFQLDVTYPQTDGGERYTKFARNALYRHAELAPEPPRFGLFTRLGFHCPVPTQTYVR
jgi:hypothetical protein